MIAASDSVSGGTFVWLAGPEAGEVLYTAGASVGYSNFRTGEPNNFRGGEDGVFAQSTGWNDVPVTNSYAYVVEYSAAIAPVPVPAGLALLLSALETGALLRARRK